MTTKDKKAAATKRKQDQRDREKEKYEHMDIRRIEIKISATERQWLDEVRQYHGGYDVNECVATLIRRAHQVMQETKAKVEPCEFCGKTWPENCEGSFKGRGECFLTNKKRALAL